MRRHRPTLTAAAAAVACSVLAAAGAPAGVRVGLGPGGTAERNPIIAREASVVVNHQFSWVGIEPERGVYDFAKADAEYAFARQHGLFQIAMHFAWDQALVDDLPGWVTDITDPDELRAVLRHRAEVIFQRYPDLQAIDVVNEPFQTVGSTLYRNHFEAVLGPDYIDELFSIVEAVAPPSVQLIVNEGGVEYLPDKAAALVALAEHLQRAGHRIAGVGFQTHLAMGDPNWANLYRAMRRVSDLGLHAWITELDVPTPTTLPHRQDVQDERYRRAAEVCLAVPRCDVLDVWGVGDVPSWYENDVGPGLDPLLFDAAYEPKPSYAALRDALAAGRTIDGGPPPFLRDQRVRDASGSTATTYPLACWASAAATKAGYGELADVTALYLQGNATALAVPARLRWSTTTTADGRAAHRARLTLDLQAVADRYLLETARPAIGLGGHHDLIDTTWLRLTGSDVHVLFEPAGSATTGTAERTLAEPLRGDTRHPVAPIRTELSWTTDLAPLGDGGQAMVDPPTITMRLRAELGVVVQGTDVSGTATLPVTCTAAGEWRELVTQVRVEPSGVPSSTPPSTPDATSPAATPATPIAAPTTYTG